MHDRYRESFHRVLGDLRALDEQRKSLDGALERTRVRLSTELRVTISADSASEEYLQTTADLIQRLLEETQVRNEQSHDDTQSQVLRLKLHDDDVIG